MKNKTVSVRVHISLDDIESLLYSARQGTTYWAFRESDGKERTRALHEHRHW